MEPKDKCDLFVFSEEKNMNEFVYQLGVDQLPDVSRAHDLLGGKGANLFEMSSLGLPVPPGFTITSEVCSYYFDTIKHFL